MYHVVIYLDLIDYKQQYSFIFAWLSLWLKISDSLTKGGNCVDTDDSGDWLEPIARIGGAIEEPTSSRVAESGLYRTVG